MNEKDDVLTALMHWYNNVKVPEELSRYNINKNDKYLTLSGAAGTGKTTLISKLLNNIEGNIVIATPTHQAKKVIQSMSDVYCCTIHSLLGIKMSYKIERFDINNVKFTQSGIPDIKGRDLIVIDEGGIVNNSLFNYLLNTCDKDCKILFVGDPYQLPPIGEEISSVFSDVKVIELLEIVRQQNDNPLIKLLTNIRESIDNNDNNYANILTQEGEYLLEDGRGYTITRDQDIFLSQIESIVKEKTNFKFLSYTDKVSQSYNTYIRNNLFNKDIAICKGDLLTGYNTISNGKKLSVMNSEDYIVNSVTEHTNNLGVVGFRVSISPVDDKTDKRSVFIVDPTDSFEFETIHKSRRNKALKDYTAWADYYKFKNRNLLITDINTDEIDLKTKRNLIIKRDLSYSYASTIHKAQGSTYEIVFLNLEDINRSMNRSRSFVKSAKEVKAIEDLRKKLIYVALSRSSHKAIIKL